MAHVRRTSAVAAVMLVLATACSDDPSPPPIDTTAPFAAYVRTGPWNVGDSAALDGRLRLADGCLVVEGDDTTTVPVFPSDFRWDPQDQTLTAFGLTLTVGEQVYLGGGFTTSTAAHVPSSCSGEHFLVQSGPGAGPLSEG